MTPTREWYEADDDDADRHPWGEPAPRPPKPVDLTAHLTEEREDTRP